MVMRMMMRMVVMMMCALNINLDIVYEHSLEDLYMVFLWVRVLLVGDILYQLFDFLLTHLPLTFRSLPSTLVAASRARPVSLQSWTRTWTIPLPASLDASASERRLPLNPQAGRKLGL